MAFIGIPRDVRYMLEQFKLVLRLEGAVARMLEEQFRELAGAVDIYEPGEAAAVDVPALVIHDEEDEVAPAAHARQLARELPRGKLLVTRGLGHCGVLRAPDALDPLVQFLRENVVARASAHSDNALRSA